MKSFIFICILCLPWRALAQYDQAPPATDYEATAYYKDSLRRHEEPYMKYYPHVCTNREGKKGYVGKMHKKVIIPFEYYELPGYLYPMMSVRKNNKMGMINDQNKLIIPFKYDAVNVSIDHQRGYAYNQNKRWGAYNNQGKLIIPEEYKEMFDFNDSLIRAYHPDKKMFYLFDHKGKVVFTIDYAGYVQSSPDRFIVYKENPEYMLVGVVDGQQKVVVPVEFFNINWARGDWAHVIKPGKITREKGLYQISQQRFIPLEYIAISRPDANGLMMTNGTLNFHMDRGMLDNTGKEVYLPKFRQIQLVEGTDLYILQNNDELWGIGNKTGKILQNLVFSTFIQAAGTVSPYGDRMDLMRMWEYTRPNTTVPGLWHPEKGFLFQPDVYSSVLVATDSSYFAQTKGGTTGLYQLGQSKPIRTFSGDVSRVQSRTFLHRLKTGNTYELLDNQGNILTTLNAPPQVLNPEFYALSTETGWALYDKNLTALTKHRFSELRNIVFLENRYWKTRAEMEETNNYGIWVAFGREDINGPVILIDQNGKTFTIKE